MMQSRDRSYVKGFYQNTQPPHAPFQPSKFAPPSPGSVGMGTGTSRCKGCGARLVFITMEETRSKMPCNAEQIYGDGRKHLVQRVDVDGEILGRMVRYAPKHVLGFEPHWGSCPKRKMFKPKSTQQDLFGGLE